MMGFGGRLVTLWAKVEAGRHLLQVEAHVVLLCRFQLLHQVHLLNLRIMRAKIPLLTHMITPQQSLTVGCRHVHGGLGVKSVRLAACCGAESHAPCAQKLGIE